MDPRLARATSAHGVLMRSAALAAGCDDRDIRAAVRAGELRRIRSGTYVWARVWDSLDTSGRHRLLVRGVVLKAGAPAVVSHTSAVVVHAGPLWGLPLDEVHVTRPDQRGGRKEAGVVQHRGALRSEDVVVIGGETVTSPARTALDVAALVGTERAIPVLDDFLHRRLTTRTELESCRQWMNRWPGTLVSNVAVALADGRHESVGESRVGYCFYLGGVPRPRPQWPVRDESGREFARLDFAWPRLGVWVEFDGKEKYLRYRRAGETVVDAVLREKRREERIARLTGWRCIRLTWADLRDPEKLAAYVLAVLAGGPVHHVPLSA